MYKQLNCKIILNTVHFVLTYIYGGTMGLETMSCPKCGAPLHFDDPAQEYCFCSHCGTQVYKTDENKKTVTIRDEGKIKETELKEKRFEMFKQYLTLKNVLITLGILIFITALIYIFFGKDAVLIIYGILLVIAMWAGLFWLTERDNRKDEERKTKRVSSADATITSQMIDCSGKNYNSVATIFKSAGFTNVNSLPLGDLSMFNQRKDGQVDIVTINGIEDYDDGDVFPKSANVLITYHSMQKK